MIIKKGGYRPPLGPKNPIPPSERKMDGDYKIDTSSIKTRIDFITLKDKLKPYVDSALGIPKAKKQRENRLERICQNISATWSEVLRWSYENNNQQVVQLNESLLPSITEEDQHYWDGALRQCGLLNEQAEYILKEFGKNEVIQGVRLNLAWDGYVINGHTGYELHGN